MAWKLSSLPQLRDEGITLGSELIPDTAGTRDGGDGWKSPTPQTQGITSL